MIPGCQILVVLLVGFLRAELESLRIRSAPDSFNNYNETEAFKYCIRKCDGQPRTCYYKLNIQRYSVLGGACRNCAFGTYSDCLRPQCITADGMYKNFVAVNRQLPAPSIQVCRGDRIVTDVQNAMSDATVTIHWHGIKQNGSQHYAGVPYVTQCPILPGTIFRYNFIVKDAGTFFYHSYTGLEKMDGVAGALIVRDVDDSQSNFYDEDRPDHVMFISDWFNNPTKKHLPGFNHPDTYLINGKGMHWANNGSVNLPLAEFMVSYCVRYRFRLIGGIRGSCGAAIIFQGHKVIAISADGNLKFSPRLVDRVIVNAGDRFDVVLEAYQEVGTYFIFVDTIHRKHCPGVRQVAILRYQGSESIGNLLPPTAPKTFDIEFNALKSNCDGKNSKKICISHLQGYTNAPAISECFASLFVGFDFHYYDDKDLFAPGTDQNYDETIPDSRYRSLVNNVSFKFPQSNMLTQFDEIPRNNLCNSQCHFRQNTKPCHCTNYYNLPYKTLINMILYDNTPNTYMRHPFYLQGFNFYVIEQGVFPSIKSTIKQKFLNHLMYRLKNDNVNLCSRPQRDTISVPSMGYVLIRFYTDNPGYWLLHCHFAFEFGSGMAVVFRVGNQSHLPPVPENFPRCGDFLPQI